ncbi:hypothetical protein GGX14DRAFT_404011 [Mycena pura]|uniref:Reverse transcriptase n=1 Tax=Mycena pura TaxID=153505 RepID=A0AAD6V1X8_9AGAR|nr:hypothetical protein GGX14DRAFT_404011 [Mycena pura]
MSRDMFRVHYERVGKRSGVPQLYSELGIYPLRARRAELAVGYLRYLISLPDSHYARKAAVEADRLRLGNHPSWMGDLALVLNAVPFATPPLPAFSAITPAVCKEITDGIRAGTRQWVWSTIEGMVSIPLLHGRLEPKESGTPSVNKLCRRHYLSRVLVADHRLALTRLLCGSFFFRGLRTNPSLFPFATTCCRKCGLECETPGHVFMLCRAEETVAARGALEDTLRRDFDCSLRRVFTRDGAEDLMRILIFDWNTVVPMARFVYQVVRQWKWFGRRLPTVVLVRRARLPGPSPDPGPALAGSGL